MSRTIVTTSAVLFVVALVFFYVSTPNGGQESVTIEDISARKELETKIIAKRAELARIVEEKNSKPKDAQTQPDTTVQKTPPADPPANRDGAIKVTAAVIYYNWPALVNGNDAMGLLLRAKHGAYSFKYNKAEKKTRYVDLTQKMQEACDGKRSCNVTFGESDLPELGRNVPHRFKVAVDYECGGHEVPFQGKGDMFQQRVVPLDCNSPKPTVIDTPCVGDICAVRYKGDLVAWPIGFSLPAQNFKWSQSWKSKDFADQIPSNGQTYRNTEGSGVRGTNNPDESYFHDYQHSFYCVTRKKMGWDCLRHYEILASGCVPYMVDIARLPANTMAFFPRELVWEAMTLPGVIYEEDVRGAFWYKESFKIDKALFNTTRYFELASQIQTYARRHLTGDAMAKYILDAVAVSGGPQKARKVLYIHHCYHDFMSDSLWSGLKELELMGELDLVADVVPPKEMSTGGVGSQWGRLHNKESCPGPRKIPQTTSAVTLRKGEYYRWVSGWGNHRSHNKFPKETEVDMQALPDRIKAHEFDVVIYGTPTRSAGWNDVVKENYKPNEVVYLFGGDMPEHSNILRKFHKSGLVFQREMYDDASQVNSELCQDAPGSPQAHDVDCCAMTDNAGTQWPTTKYDKARWTTVAKENEEFTCSTVARFGHHTGSDSYDYIDLKGVTTTARCNLKPKGIFNTEKAPGWVKKCHCKHEASDVDES